MSFDTRNNYSIGMSIEHSFLKQAGRSIGRMPIRIDGKDVKVGQYTAEQIHRSIFNKETLILENYSQGEGKDKTWHRRVRKGLIPTQEDRTELFAVDYYANQNGSIRYGNIKAMTVSASEKVLMRWDESLQKKIPDGYQLSLVGKKVEITSGIGVSAVRFLLKNSDYYVLVLVPYDNYSSFDTQAFIVAEFNYSEYYRRCVAQNNYANIQTDKYLDQYGLNEYGIFKRVKLEQYDFNNRGTKDNPKIGQISLHCKPFNMGFQTVYPISEWTRPPEIWEAKFDPALSDHQSQVDSYVWSKSDIEFPLELYRF